MKREYSYCFGAIIILLAAGCSPPQDPQKIEIAVPAVQRGDLEKLSDPSYLFPDYKGPRPTLNGQGLNIFGPVRLFVRKGAEPKTAGDFKTEPSSSAATYLSTASHRWPAPTHAKIHRCSTGLIRIFIFRRAPIATRKPNKPKDLVLRDGS